MIPYFYMPDQNTAMRDPLLRLWLEEKRRIFEAEQDKELAEARLAEITEQLAPLLESGSGEILEGYLWTVKESVSTKAIFDKERDKQTFYEKYPAYTKTIHAVNKSKILKAMDAGIVFDNLEVQRKKQIITKSPTP